MEALLSECMLLKVGASQLVCKKNYVHRFISPNQIQIRWTKSLNYWFTIIFMEQFVYYIYFFLASLIFDRYCHTIFF